MDPRGIVALLLILCYGGAFVGSTVPGYTSRVPDHPALQEVTGSHPAVQEVTRSHPAVQEVTRSHPAVQEVTGSHPALQEVTTSHPAVQEVTGSHPAVQKVTGSHPAVQEVTGSHPAVQEVTRSHPAVQEVTGSHPEVQEVTGSHPEVQEVTGSHPEVQEVTRSHPEVQEVTRSHPEVQEVTGSHPAGQGVTGSNVKESVEDTLEDESENQENILSQLLGDYDKVKAISEGGDCRCKCVVKPLNRDACAKQRAGSPLPTDDYYTVETITSGAGCKCACVAPPSALNPCEGDFRLRKLQEAEQNGFKVSNILEMLEGAFYGLDLLKLHSVTTKMIGRIEKLEEVISKSSTKDKEQVKAAAADSAQTGRRYREEYNETRRRNEELDGIGKILQRDAAAAYTDSQENYEERFLKDEKAKAEGIRPRSSPQQAQRWPISSRHVKDRSKAPRPPRGMTFYKAKDTDDDSDFEDLQDDAFSGDNAIDMLIEDQLIKHDVRQESATEDPFPPRETSPHRTDASAAASVPSPAATFPTTGSPQQVTTTHQTSPAATTPPAAQNIEPLSASALDKGTAAPERSHPVLPTSRSKKTITNDDKEEEDDLVKVIGRCKDTLSTISGPTTQNTYGRNEGAWMKDPLAKDEKIYITNYYYGNTLVEFRNLDNFKQGRWSNSYKLPYSWIGTGHVVYNGSFYYNRAFTRNIIKYDLKNRYVAAWAMLHDVVYDEATPWRWRGHSDIDFAIDENGLWLIYPALDEDSFQQEVIVLSKLNSVDLTIQKETTWRTGLRKDFYGNCFVICGVLYAVDNYNKKTANISYAFDTHTNTQIVPRLLFENEYAYTTQIDYNPKDRLLYAWDNGHQVTYNVIFAY